MDSVYLQIGKSIYWLIVLLLSFLAFYIIAHMAKGFTKALIIYVRFFRGIKFVFSWTIFTKMWSEATFADRKSKRFWSGHRKQDGSYFHIQFNTCDVEIGEPRNIEGKNILEGIGLKGGSDV